MKGLINFLKNLRRNEKGVSLLELIIFVTIATMLVVLPFTFLLSDKGEEGNAKPAEASKSRQYLPSK